MCSLPDHASDDRRRSRVAVAAVQGALLRSPRWAFARTGAVERAQRLGSGPKCCAPQRMRPDPERCGRGTSANTRAHQRRHVRTRQTQTGQFRPSCRGSDSQVHLLYGPEVAQLVEQTIVPRHGRRFDSGPRGPGTTKARRSAGLRVTQQQRLSLARMVAPRESSATQCPLKDGAAIRSIVADLGFEIAP
jgi:hypothetical protein